MPPDIPEPVNWANLVIQQDKSHDGDATAAADEDKVYEPMGFRAADEGQNKQQGKQYLFLQ